MRVACDIVIRITAHLCFCAAGLHVSRWRGGIRVEESGLSGRVRGWLVGVPVFGAAALLAMFLHGALFSSDHGLTVIAMARTTSVAEQDVGATVKSSITVDYPQDG